MRQNLQKGLRAPPTAAVRTPRRPCSCDGGGGGAATRYRLCWDLTLNFSDGTTVREVCWAQASSFSQRLKRPRPTLLERSRA